MQKAGQNVKMPHNALICPFVQAKNQQYLQIFKEFLEQLPWVPEATRLLNPAGQNPAKRAWGPKWAKRRTRVASGGEPQQSHYVRYRFCTWSLIGYLKTCFFQRPQLVKAGHVKWTGFFSKTEWCLVEKKCVQQRDFIEGKNLYSVSFKIWENYNT